MPPGTSGLERDLNLVRRRAWLFIPFAILGILAALFVGRATGDSNAVASLTLDTTVHDLVAGGDRGLRIFEAQEMTSDDRFRQKVKDAIGDQDFDFGRFAISLSPISVADGISRGILTVSITDPDKASAEKYRQAFVDVFQSEYVNEEGLYRQKFLERRVKVAEDNQAEYLKAYSALKASVPASIAVDAYLETRGNSTPSTASNEALARLQVELAQVDATLAAAAGASPAALAAAASSLLGQPVAAADAQAALTLKRAALAAATASFSKSATTIAESQLNAEQLRLLDTARGLRQVKEESYIRLANAQVAVQSAESHVDASYSFSGGLAGSLLGRIAVALAVTIVFGLVAIYTLEWLSPARTSK
ncbi:hypothetical protein [Candidatus Amarobacter glycogenicus]|uniref:hypothetical protein n=1 Tax=Candidatus Amarobacter glycogenicus TaxID=3140699 RepID=UPI002A112187|nr:hypothetical protein [Dehalococcoidia bacterium]